jgi:hypothetical protein
MLYADVEYFENVHQDAELVNGKWYFERRPGEVNLFALQAHVKVLSEPQSQPRHRQNVRPDVRIFGIDESRPKGQKPT